MKEQEQAPSAPATQALLTTNNGQQLVARPIVSPEQARTVIAEWAALKAAIATESDVYREERGGKVVEYYKKSYWRKAATFLGITVEATPGSERFEVIGGAKVASVNYSASVPGRKVTGDGHCGSDERGKERWTIANLLATAHSRAYNRAVSNCIGGGEVSADELEVVERPATPTPAKPAVDVEYQVEENVFVKLRQKIDSTTTRDDCAALYKEIHANANNLTSDELGLLKSACSARGTELAATTKGGASNAVN